MKLKAISGIMLTLSLVTMLFAVPIKSTPTTVKIGVFGPLAWPVGESHYQAAVLAAEEIGTILGTYPIEIVFADSLRGQPDPTSATGAAAMLELMAAGVDFAIGGFRSEAGFGAREVAMDYKRIYIISGCGTTHLISCESSVYMGVCTGPATGAPCGYLPGKACNATFAGTYACTSCTTSNYGRYKYLFRVTPMNSSMLLRAIVGHFVEGITGFTQWVLGTKLVPIFGKWLINATSGLPDPDIKHPLFGFPVPQVKVAVIAASAVWADVIYQYLITPTIYPALLGPWANVTYYTRASEYATDLTTEISAAVASGARLIIQLFSGPAGRAFTTQWRDIGYDAVAIGINVPGAEVGPPSHWELTGGKAEFEAFLWTAGERVALSPVTVPFYDAYMSKWGHAPMYTGYGVYDAIYMLKEAIERLGYFFPGNQTFYDEVVTELEATDRIGVAGRFKFTGPSGTHHDLYMVDLGDTWPEPKWVRAMNTQWQYNIAEDKPKLEVVNPRDQPFSRRYEFPDFIYDHADRDFIGGTVMRDITGTPINATAPDGLVDTAELGALRLYWGRTPDKWILEMDQDSSGFINVYDASYVAREYGYDASTYYPTYPFGAYSDP